MLRYLLRVAALSAAYFLLARFSLQAGVLPGNVSPVWPPAGLAIASVVLAGPRMLPGVFLGELLANSTSGLPVWVAACMATGNVLEAGAAYAFGVRWWKFDRRLDRMDDVLRYLLLAAMVSTAVSATVGVAALMAAGVVPGAAAQHAWLTWWLGDALGAVIVGAPILVWWGRPRLPRRGQLAHVVLGFAGLLGTSLFVFHSRDGFPYLVFPFVVWAALRFSQRGATAAMLLVSVVAVNRTAHGAGPFTLRGTVNDQLWLLDLFLVVVAGTALALASVVTERDRARGRLKALNASLERRVDERTEALRAERSKLAEAQQVGHVGSYEWDLEKGVVTWSDELFRLFGLAPGECTPTRELYLSLMHPDDRAGAGAAMAASMALREPTEINYRICRPDGEVRWMSSRSVVTEEADGRPTRVSGTAQDVTTFVQLHDELEHRAMHDPLTGLPNRTRFTELLTQAFADQLPTGRRHDDGALAVLFVDVDRFKWINDSLGHEAGDEVLCAIAHRLRESLREDGVVARFGGDEFVVLCPRLSAPDDASAIARRLLLALAEPFHLAGREIPLSASVGVALAAEHSSAEAVLRDADVAMYRAKELGGASVAVYDDALSGTLRHRFETAHALNRALQSGQVVPHYQPIVDLVTGRVVGVEALARWLHPERGLVPPSEFIPIAEQSGLVVALGAALLQTACTDAAAWNAARLRPISLAVNVSARQIASRDFAATVAESLRSSGLSADRLCLELTESSLMQDVEATRVTVAELRELGVRLSVDDFGTGYSSLLYLRRFPVTSLKIDRSFVAGLPDEADDSAIVTGVIELAHGLGLSTVAEGVETQAQLDRLREAGCEQGQGFLWSPAKPAAELLAWLKDQDGLRIPEQGRQTRLTSR